MLLARLCGVDRETRVLSDEKDWEPEERWILGLCMFTGQIWFQVKFFLT